MLGKDAAQKLNAVLLSDNSVSQPTGDMGQDRSAQLSEQVRASEYFTLELDESRNVCNAAQLLVYIRSISQGRFFLRKYYFGKHLKVEPLGETIFKFWTSASNLMDWSCYVWGCSNGSAAMTGMNTAPIKQKALNAVATHLVAKRIDD